MNIEHLVIYATIILIIFIIFIFFSGKQTCSREGMANGVDTLIQETLDDANIQINTNGQDIISGSTAPGSSIHTPAPGTPSPAHGAHSPAHGAHAPAHSTPSPASHQNNSSNNIVVTHDLDENTLALLERGADMLQRMEPDAQNQDGGYNHFKKSGMPLLYYAPNGSKATLLMRFNTYAISITNSNGTTTLFVPTVPSANQSTTTNNGAVPTIPQEITNTTFHDNNGSTATIFRANNGQYIIRITGADGSQIMYVPDTRASTSPSQTNVNSGASTPASGTPSSASETSSVPNSLPIEEDDRYILKTQIVPPVCPRCPSICNSNPNEQSPPCPSCGNKGTGCSSGHTTTADTTSECETQKDVISPKNGYCPTENTTDKYSKYRTNSQFEPVPVTADFSSF
jgi:hypothetical protein